MKVLLISAELAPYAKAGGLADVAGSLPKALKALGVDVRVMIPAYPMVLEMLGSGTVRSQASIPSASTGQSPARILSSVIPASPGHDDAIPLYLVEDATGAKGRKPWFSSATDSAHIYALEPEPYAFFCRAALAWLTEYSPGWTPDIVHCNDWHTGLIPLLLQQRSTEVPTWCKPASLFTIHNLAYQGDFPADKFACTGLSQDYYGIDGVEFYGRWTFMKAALNFSDHVNTVSPGYCKEILTPEYGCGLDGLLRKLMSEGKLSGILNGIDTDIFNPEMDKLLVAPYSARLPGGKLVCREALQRELCLQISSDRPIIGMVTRFAEQKGFDLVEAEAERILEMPVQLALLGQGETRYEQFLLSLQARYPSRVSVTIGYDAALAQRIYAGADLFLMPSRFEPCGLGQMIAMRYGTLPIVRATGGLADTVVDFSYSDGTGCGFVFDEYSGEALTHCIERAVEQMQSPANRTTLSCRAMEQDFSWKRSARDYIALYTYLESVRQ